MTDSSSSNNPYEAYFRAMMDMQMEMAKSYAAMQQNGELPPMMPPFMPPHGANPFMHPHMAPHFYNGMPPPPPHWGYGTPPPQPHQMHNAPPQPEQSQNSASDPLFEQAQSMLEGALGEDASMFNEILGTFGMSDKEFWKGAVVGAAAALLLSNENVRGKLMGLVSGAGDMIKTGGSSVKDAAVTTASSVKDNVSTGSEIFRDTVAAGKQGYQESVEKHRAEPAIKEVAASTPEPSEDSQSAELVIKEQ
ncbi:YtxH domain-containing protein [Vibrio mediterranei]|uniref:YtxH domain-containing protein n=1 Tax=Vibrio mediterranei TaxID=689 RepID=UPI00148C889E|nr:YtxH domain-containing protein [Vibrio mediterranei]NOH30963.1 YtxH domain-containing protein [Vibrio mediterranei]